MGFLENNLALMQAQNDGFALYEQDDEENRFYVEISRTGKPILKYENDEKTRYLESRFDPEREGLDFAKKYQSKIEKTNVIVLFGMGMGYVVRGLMKIMNPNNMLIVCEPSWLIVKLAMENSDLSDILTDRRIAFIFGRHTQDAVTHLKSFINIDNYEKLVYMSTPGYQEIYLEEYKKVTLSLSEVVKKSRILFETFRAWGKVWTETIIKNINHILDSYALNNIKSKFTNKPVVVVGAGPSLDKNIDHLKKVEGKFFIICVYPAYKALQLHGIRPDLIVTLDAEQTKIETEDQKKETYDIPVVYLCISDTSLLNRFTGRKIYAHTEHDVILNKIMTKDLLTAGYIYVGGSVTISALYLAALVGGNPVIITGLDLAYPEDGKGHVSGTYHDKINDNKPVIRDVVWLDGVNGGKVKSTLLFEDYLKSTEHVIASNPHIKFIDATEGGALKKGAEIDTLEHVIETYGDLAVESTDKIIDEALNEKLFNEEDLKSIEYNLNETKKLTSDLLKYLKEGKEYSENLKKTFTYGNPSEKEKDNIVKFYYELDDKINNIMESTPLFYTMIERIKFILKTHQPDQETSSEMYFVNHALILYNDMLEATEKADAAISEILNQFRGVRENG